VRASPQRDREGERVDVSRSSHRDGSSDRGVRLRGIGSRQRSIYRPGQGERRAKPIRQRALLIGTTQRFCWRASLCSESRFMILDRGLVQWKLDPRITAATTSIRARSVPPPTTDMKRLRQHVRLVPQADLCTAANKELYSITSSARSKAEILAPSRCCRLTPKSGHPICTFMSTRP
jgi:hypothetical protein